MSFTTYKLTIEIPIANPSGDPPGRFEIVAINEATGAAVEFTETDAGALRAFVIEAWRRGRPLV